MSGSNTPSGVSRRSFLVVLGSSVLGKFFLPQLGETSADAVEPAEEATSQGDERVRRLISKPTKKNTEEGRFFLLWAEIDENEDVQTMIWQPETPDELAEAQRFYDAARNFVPDELQGAPAAAQHGDEERALLQAVIDNLEDEEYLLKYAWWLEEHGNPRGEFIRLCHEIDHLPPAHPRIESANEQWWSLLDQHAAEWLRPLAALGLQPVILGQFMPALWLTRGVVEEIEIDKPGILPEQAERLFQAAPLLHRIVFNYERPDVAAIVGSTWMRQVTSLGLMGLDLTDDDIAALVGSPHLGRLRELTISTNNLGPEAAALLAASPLLAQLRRLKASYCDFGFEGVQRLLTSPYCANLEHLDLGNEDLGEEGARLLAESPHLANLTSLRLSCCNLGAEGLRQLAQSRYLSKLRVLNVESNQAGDAGVKALAESPYLTRLKELQLSGNELGCAAVQALAQSPNFAGLEQLFLSRNQIGDAGVAALAASPHGEHLVTLELRENQLSARAAQHLAGSPHLANLRRLDVYDNKLGVGGAKALAASPHLQHLESLYIDAESIGQAGRSALARRWSEDVLNFF